MNCARTAACKRTQQLPTLLRKQCWELLRAYWQRCANGCNNSKQCWDLQCIVGRIQPISVCKPCATTCNRVCKRTQHVTSNNAGSCWPTILRPFARGLKVKVERVYALTFTRDLSYISLMTSSMYPIHVTFPSIVCL